MDTAKVDAPQAVVDGDYNAVKHTINDFMTGNISAADASTKFAAEASTIIKDHSADQVTARLNAAAKIPSEFPGLSILTSSSAPTFKESSSSNQTEVGVFNNSSNNEFSFQPQTDAQARIYTRNKVEDNPQLKAAEKDIADKILTVSSAYLNGKLDAKSTESQLSALVKSGDDPLNYGTDQWSDYRASALQTEVGAEAAKYGLDMTTRSYNANFALWQPGGNNWNAVNFSADKASTISSTTERLKTDAIYAATGAAAGGIAFVLLVPQLVPSVWSVLPKSNDTKQAS